MNFKLFLNKYTEFLERFFSQSKQNKVIGIDVGTSSIKAVEICRLRNFLELQRWALEPVENGDVKTALQRLCTRMSIKDQILVASVSGKGILIRYVDMFRMSLQEVRKSFKYEADKYFPFDLQSIYTDFYIADPQSKEKRMTMLLVAAKKEIVDERVKVFKEIGIDLAFVTTNSIAMANAFDNGFRSHDAAGANAILDIGASLSSLMILDKNGSPVFTRDMFMGSQDIAKEGIGNLVNEIQLSVDYLAMEKNIPVKELFLLGAGLFLKETEGALEKGLNIPVKIWNPLAGFRLGPEVASSQIGPFSSQLGVAIGLALTKI